MRISYWSSDVCSSDLHVGISAKPADRLERAQIAFLEDVLGLAVVAYHAARDAEQPLVAPRHDRGEGVAITCARAAQQIVVGAGSSRGGMCDRHDRIRCGVARESSRRRLRRPIPWLAGGRRSEARRVGKECGETFRPRW